MSDTGKWRAADYVPDGVSTVMLVMLLFACWVSYRNVPPAPVALVAPAEAARDVNPWACERQTVTTGKDVFDRWRDESFCPIPDPVSEPSLVDTDL